MANRPLNRILYVEDEPDIQTVACMALETIGGFTLQACSSGHEAIEAAPAFVPDLILLDVMMPGMDGPATMEALRNLPVTAGIDVIFMTAKVQSHEVERYLDLGALEVIAKPFDPMTLAAQVQAIWDRQHENPETDTSGLTTHP